MYFLLKGVSSTMSLSIETLLHRKPAAAKHPTKAAMLKNMIQGTPRIIKLFPKPSHTLNTPLCSSELIHLQSYCNLGLNPLLHKFIGPCLHLQTS